MKPSHKIAVLLTIAAVVTLGCPKEEAPKKPGAGPREAGAAELALVAPLVKGSKLLEYTVDGITLVPGQGLLVSLVKAGGFLPDGGANDGGNGCDPSHPDEARVGFSVTLVPDAGSDALIKGPYAIRARPVSMPQAEADRLAAAFVELIKVDGPVPPSLADGAD